MTAHGEEVNNKHTPTGTDRRTPGRPADPITELRRIASRLHDLEKEAAVLGTELLSLEADLHSALTAPRIPVEAYKIEEVAEAIGLGRSTVAALVGSGELPSIQRGDGGFRRVLPEDLRAYLNSLRNASSEDPS